VKRIVMLVVLAILVLGVMGTAAAEVGGKLPGFTVSSARVRPMEVGGKLPPW